MDRVKWPDNFPLNGNHTDTLKNKQNSGHAFFFFFKKYGQFIKSNQSTFIKKCVHINSKVLLLIIVLITTIIKIQGK